MQKLGQVLSLAAVATLALAGCGGDGDDDAGNGGGSGGDLCAGVDRAELEEIWGDVDANEIGGMCSILVANGTALALTRADAEGEAGVEELESELIGGETEDADIGDEALAFRGSSSGDGFIVRVGDVVFKLAAVDLPEGQMEATARSIASNL